MAVGWILLSDSLELMPGTLPAAFQDHGNFFTYTGSGGRDLSGNKRTAEQSCDQKLTNTNRYGWGRGARTQLSVWGLLADLGLIFNTP